jgi:hypothetical protein
MLRSRLLTRAGLRCVAQRKHVMQLHNVAKPQSTKKRSAVLVASFYAAVMAVIIVEDVLLVRKHKPDEVVTRLQAALSENNGTLESLHEVRYAHDMTDSVQHYCYRCTSHLDNKYAAAVEGLFFFGKTSARLEVTN